MSKRDWKSIRNFEDIRFEKWNHIAKITINRPKVYNAFRPTTTTEMSVALDICREDADIYTIILISKASKFRSNIEYIGRNFKPLNSWYVFN